MKKNFHPELHDVHVRCVCGFSLNLKSTEKTIQPNICSNCHPFYTGAQKFVDTAGRIDRFQQRYAQAKNKKK